MSKKMTKDIKYTVEQANKLLATPLLQMDSNARETLHHFIQHILLEKNMYHGFNFFVEVTLPSGKKMLKLAGKETTLIQFYVH